MPDYISGTITCPLPPIEPPTEAKMTAVDPQPVVTMCPGMKARYECSAGGINVRSDKPTLSTIDVTCKDDQTYAEPSTWPTCVDKLDCTAPSVDDTVMKHDWTSGLTPPFSIKYDLFINYRLIKIQTWI